MARETGMSIRDLAPLWTRRDPEGKSPYDNGMLKVTLPNSPASRKKVKKIAVTAGNGK